MSEKLIRIGTIYTPVIEVNKAAEWYVEKLDAHLSYIDEDKAIVNLADISFFLVKSSDQEHNYFYDVHNNVRFPITFEVNGYRALSELHEQLIEKGVSVGEIEDRGHAGNNFIFHDLDGNVFDVWSELSPTHKNK